MDAPAPPPRYLPDALMSDSLLLGKTDPRRKIASLFLHPGCDLACTFCGAESRFDTMNPEQVRQLLAALAGRSFESVVFGGGEPLLWPHDLESAIEEARLAGLHVQVSTHAQHLRTDLVRNGSIGRFLLPLESVSSDLHDALRGEGHHAQALKAVVSCFDVGREVTITTVLCRPNLHAARALAGRMQAWKEAGAPLHAWHIYRFTPVGRHGRREANALVIGGPEFRDAVNAMRKEAPGVRIYRRDNFLRASRVEYFWYEGGLLRLGSRRKDA